MSRDGSPMRGVELIARFLGPTAASGGPFALLGLDPTACTPSAIEAALQRQFDRISQHPASESREADQVRLALDTAASELLDPISRAAWIAESKRGDGADPAIALQPEKPLVDQGAGTGSEEKSPPVQSEVVEAAERVSRDHAETTAPREVDPLIMRMLIRVAIGLGLTVLALLGGLWLVSPAPRQIAGRGEGGGASTSSEAVTPEASTSVEPAKAGTSSDGGRNQEQAPAAADLSPAMPPLPPLRERGRSEFADAAYVVRELRGAAADASSDPDRALGRFERAYAIVGDWWCRYEPGQLRAAADAVVEMIYKLAARPDHLARLVGTITDGVSAVTTASSAAGNPVRAMGADEVWPAAWSAGVLARVNRERELPPQTLATLARALSDITRGVRSVTELSIEAGIDAAFVALPRAIIAGAPPVGEKSEEINKASAAAIRRWVEGITLSSGARVDRRDRMLSEGLAWIMIEAAEPEADPRVFDAITLIGAEIKWRSDAGGGEGGGARARLIDWFRDPRVSNSDLRVLTSAVATRSGAEGVDQTMVLSMSAQSDDRPGLRDRYAQAWGLADASTQADAARDWVSRARLLVDFVPREDELDYISATADLAALSREAVKIWRGESATGSRSSIPAPINLSTLPAAPIGAGSGKVASQPGAPAASGGVTGDARDGAWAENYLRAERNIPVRLERLNELEMLGPPIGWIDAGVLAEAACFASPAQVRAAAQKVVAKFADEPAMVSAMLDYLPMAPRVKSVSDTFARVGLASLPRPADADWEIITRRALVERLLSMVADDGVHGQIEQTAMRIAAAYLDAAGEPPPSGTADGAATGAVRGASILVEQMQRELAGLPISHATRLNPDALKRKAEQRRAQAIGPVQMFAAEQVTLAETLGCLMAGERPQREAGVVEILDQMSTQRRRSKHVFGQLWSAERAIVRLWLLRLATEGAT